MGEPEGAKKQTPMKKYIKPTAEAMDFCVEGNILANSTIVDPSTTAEQMFSNEKQFTKSIWSNEE